MTEAPARSVSSSMRESARLEEVVRAGGEPIAVQPGHDVAFAERPEELLAQGAVPADRRRRGAGEELLKVGRHLDPQGRRARRPRGLDDVVAGLWLGSE